MNIKDPNQLSASQLRNDIRKQVRHRRQQLTPEQQASAAAEVARRATKLPEYQNGRDFGIYFTNDAELDTGPLIQTLREDGKATAVPVLHPFHRGRLLFMRWQDDELKNNKYGIAEPPLACHKIIPIDAMQLLFVPLVAFDAQGNRLGMGGGYYDRTLQRWAEGNLTHLLPVGLAYDQQQVDEIPTESWDVPLPMILTPSRTWIFNRTNEGNHDTAG